jgi:hypothetical protein
VVAPDGNSCANEGKQILRFAQERSAPQARGAKDLLVVAPDGNPCVNQGKQILRFAQDDKPARV